MLNNVKNFVTLIVASADVST